MAQMKQVHKELAASAAMAIAIFSGRSMPAETSYSNGFISATKEMQTNGLLGLVRIDDLKAASFPNSTGAPDPKIDDTIAFGEASVQLNAFLRGEKEDGESQDYWVQDVITIGYKDGHTAYQYQSEIYPANAASGADLKLDDISGKGKLYKINNEKPGRGNTYIWSSSFKKFEYPANGYLVMKEKLDNGQISLAFSYINESSSWGKSNEEIVIDQVKIGRPKEFSKSYFTISYARDAELGIVGGGNGDVSYFSRLNAYLGIFAYRDRHFEPLAYSNDITFSSEYSGNLACTGKCSEGIVELKVNTSDDYIVQKVNSISDNDMLGTEQKTASKSKNR